MPLRIGGRQSGLVFGDGARTVLLRDIGIAAHLVIRRRERRRNRLGQRFDRFIGFALVDQNSRQAQGGDMAQFSILGVVHDLRQ